MPGNCKTGAYGCHHTPEHIKAGRKSWVTRRKSQTYRNELGAFRLAIGEHASHLQTDPNHRSKIMFRVGDNWYHMDKAEYRSLATAGRILQREQAKEQRRADLEAERARKRGEKAAAIEAKKRARYERAEARYREEMTRQAENVAIREYRAFKADLRKRGVRPSSQMVYRRHLGKEVPADYAEWRMLPSDIRRRTGRLTLDDARGEAEDRISFGITDTGKIGARNFDYISDLINYMEYMEQYIRDTRRRRAERAAA